MLIPKDKYDIIFSGYYIIGVAAGSNGCIYLTLREAADIDPVMEERRALKRIVTFHSDKSIDNSWRFITYKNMNRIHSATTETPSNQYVGVDVRREVLVIENDFSGLEDPIPEGRPVRNCRTICGRLYIVGSARYVVRRIDKNNWQTLSNGIKLPTKEEVKNRRGEMLFLSAAGFDCIDGFSESDIYAAGGKGDVWHFDGDEWRQIHFPSNMLIESICCGQDGHVYIGAQSGTVFKGRKDQWKMIHRGALTLPFRQMVWFQDRVWATSDYGVWQIIGDDVIEADLPAEVRMCSGYISCTENILVLAGYFGVARLENGHWDILVNCVRAEKGDFSSDQ